jgi:predicted DNA-binding transcriptional regulator AlpA
MGGSQMADMLAVFRRGQSLGLNAQQCADLVGCGVATWWRRHYAGAVPAPVRIGLKKLLWRREEIESWLRAGAPSREQWESRKAAN